MNDGKIKIRVDEWVSEVEMTPEGTFIYISNNIKEEVLEELKKVLGGGCG